MVKDDIYGFFLISTKNSAFAMPLQWTNMGLNSIERIRAAGTTNSRRPRPRKAVRSDDLY
ncbi:hypothetical protein E2C01_037714 [Portunus trituberculatus]|uniref:Uncharacterized protein n=1 Tax=Portunus trituberculatus TaxID=210409 RepID=A0A5B7FHR4_PORTR|nr:hypothetical protein [Portunus trituberculatus]